MLEITPGCSKWPYALRPRANNATVRFLNEMGHQAEGFDPVPLYHRPWRLLRDIKERRPDVVVTRHASAILLCACRRLGLLRTPVVHAWDDYYAEQSTLPFWTFWPLEVLSVKWADHVTTVSRYNEQLARKWGVPCTFIPHGTHEPTRPTTMRLESNRLKIVYLGDQNPYKGVGKLVEAVRGTECDLFMVGEPHPDLMPVSPPNVHFVGTVPAEEVQAVLAQADVLANPSDQDSNFKFFEYIRAGKPILGIKGRAEYAFRNGEDALLVDDLREGVERLIREPELRALLAANVRKREWLTWEQAVRRLESVLYEVVERARGR